MEMQLGELAARRRGRKKKDRVDGENFQTKFRFFLFYFFLLTFFSLFFFSQNQNQTKNPTQETTAFAARWDFDVSSGSPLAGGRWEWLSSARKKEEEEGEEEEEDEEEEESAAAARRGGVAAAAAAAAPTKLTADFSFPRVAMRTSPPESDRASTASPAPSCGGGGGNSWPV